MNETIKSDFTIIRAEQSRNTVDTKIHYLHAGKGSCILFLHGWPTSSYLWRDLMPVLAKEHRVIALDLPGFGMSDKRLEDSYSFKYYARILSGFLDNLKIDSVSLGVHDLGGPIGLYWMAQNTECVDRLILFNTLVYPEFSWAVKLFGLATMMPGIRSLITSQEGIKRAIYFGVSQKHKLTEEIIEQYQAPFRDKTSRKVLLKTVQRLSVKGFDDIQQMVGGFKGPVQILYGKNDKILPKVSRTMKRVKSDMPQARIQSFPNCGHFLQEECAEELGEAILEFLKL